MDRGTVIEARRQAQEKEKREASEYMDCRWREMWEKESSSVSKDSIWGYVQLPVPFRCSDCGHVMKCCTSRLVRREREKDPHGKTLAFKNFFRCCECSFVIMFKKGSPLGPFEAIGGEVADLLCSRCQERSSLIRCHIVA